MLITSSVLVARLLLDLLPATAPVVVPPAPQVFTEEHGVGQLHASIMDSAIVGSVPMGATRVQMMSLNLSASCDSDIAIDEITLKHVGLGEASDIEGVYIMENGRRLGRSVRFDSNSARATVRTKNLVIAKCDARRIDVFVDMSRTANIAGEHGVTVPDAQAFVSTAKEVTLSSTDITKKVTTAAKDAGSISVDFLPINERIRYGRIETVARIQLRADSKNDHIIRSILFTNQENARDMDLINLRLETRSGQILTRLAPRMQAKEVKLDFTPSYTLTHGTMVVLLLKAEVRGSVTKKVNFTIEEGSDINSNSFKPR